MHDKFFNQSLNVNIKVVISTLRQTVIPIVLLYFVCLFVYVLGWYQLLLGIQHNEDIAEQIYYSVHSNHM